MDLDWLDYDLLDVLINADMRIKMKNHDVLITKKHQDNTYKEMLYLLKLLKPSRLPLDAFVKKTV